MTPSIHQDLAIGIISSSVKPIDSISEYAIKSVASFAHRFDAANCFFTGYQRQHIAPQRIGFSSMLQMEESDPLHDEASDEAFMSMELDDRS